MFAVAAVVSVTAPLFVMIMFFQRQIVVGPDRRGREGLRWRSSPKRLWSGRITRPWPAPPPTPSPTPWPSAPLPTGTGAGCIRSTNRPAPQAVAATFWSPFLAAFSRVQRREDIFIAGLNEIDGFKGRLGHLDGPPDGAPRRALPRHPADTAHRHAALCRIQPGRGRPDHRNRAFLRPDPPDDAGRGQSVAATDRRAIWCSPAR